MTNDDALTTVTVPVAAQFGVSGIVLPVTETVAPTVSKGFNVVLAPGPKTTSTAVVLLDGVNRKPLIAPFGS